MKERTAQCACGNAKITTRGEPDRVLGCHCRYCQKRTGSVLAVAAWFKDDQIVAISGETRLFNESARSKGVRFQFCPTCGTTLYWTFTHTSGYHAIALGCFTDPAFPTPGFEMHTAKRHHWMHPIPGAAQFPAWPPAEYLK